MKEEIWDKLLQIKEKVYGFKSEINRIYVEQNRLLINELPSSCSQVSFIINFENKPIMTKEKVIVSFLGNGRMLIQNEEKLAGFDKILLQNYLPFCVAPVLAKKHKSPLTIAHFAQSLDGYIATVTNHARWIGNEENLLHAHRLRALVDGIVIGNNTLLKDKPKLTVRLVKGVSPKRIVIGNTGNSMESMKADPTVDIIRIVNDENEPKDKHCQYLEFCPKTHPISTTRIKEALYEKNIYSILIEGGSFTTSCFLKEQNIDILQLHLAPRIFGSGIKNFLLPEIEKVQEGIHFEQFYYTPIGNTTMFTGFLNE